MFWTFTVKFVLAMQPPPRKVWIYLIKYLKKNNLDLESTAIIGFLNWNRVYFLQVKHCAVLKTTHSEQVSKLQQKHQQECDLLEDIR